MNLGFTISVSSSDAGRPVIRLISAGGEAGRAGLVTRFLDPATGDVALVIGRLHYREESAEPPARDESDASWALARYRRSGAEGLARLEGEFSLVVWDASSRKLLARRDPFGSYPLFWGATGSGLTLGTSLRSVVEDRGLASFDLDAEYVAEFIMRPSASSEVAGDRTAHSRVRRVPSGSMLEFADAGRPRSLSTWDWSTQVADLPEMTLDEAAGRFADLFGAAVRERARDGSVAAHLSGGMDSSAVARVAADCLRGRGTPSPLIALSRVYDCPSLVGERAYIDLALEGIGPAESHRLPSDHALAYQWFDRPLPRHDEPYGGMATVATERVTLDAAARLGVDTLLTGVGSDEVAEAVPFHLADLIRRGRLRPALRESARWARAWNVGLWSILGPFGLAPLRPSWTQALRAGRRGSWRDVGRFGVPTWIAPDFARRQRMAERGARYAARPAGRSAALSASIEAVAGSTGDSGPWYLAAPAGVHVAHPFRDPRLIRFALGLPPSVRCDPLRRKPLLEEATRGILPEPIRTRREKRGFDDVYGRGLARNLGSLERLVEASPAHELGILDKAELVRAMRQASMGMGGVEARERIDKTLALVAWLDQVAS